MRQVVVAAASYALAACCTAAAAAGLAAAPGDVGAWLCPDCDGFWRVPSSALPALLWWIFMSTVLNYALMLWAVAASSPTLVTAFSALQPIAAAGVTLAALASRPRFRCRGAADARCLRPPAASDGLAAALVVAGLSLVVRTELRATRRPRADYVGVELEER